MSAYLTDLMATAHASELAEEARRARPARGARTRRPRSRGLRASTARLLVAVAVRLDHRLESAPLHASPPGART